MIYDEGMRCGRRLMITPILVHFSSPLFPSINSSFTLAFRLYNCQAPFCWDVRFSLELPKLQEEFTKPPTPAYTKLNYQQIEYKEVFRSLIPGNLMVNYHPNSSNLRYYYVDTFKRN